MYVLRPVLILKVSGLREVCFSRPSPSHDCCPASKDKSLPDRCAVPECYSKIDAPNELV
jgi:hypothetical protein